MKKRTGFVSNSSSSSFIVSFEKDPTDEDNLAEMMGDCFSNYDDCPTESIIKRVHQDIIDGSLATEDEIKAELRYSLPFDVYEEFRNKVKKFSDEFDYDLLGYMLDEHTKPKFEKLKEGKFVYILNYADNEGEAYLEHGDIFRNVEHYQNSHH